MWRPKFQTNRSELPVFSFMTVRFVSIDRRLRPAWFPVSLFCLFSQSLLALLYSLQVTWLHWGLLCTTFCHWFNPLVVLSQPAGHFGKVEMCVWSCAVSDTADFLSLSFLLPLCSCLGGPFSLCTICLLKLGLLDLLSLLSLQFWPVDPLCL